MKVFAVTEDQYKYLEKEFSGRAFFRRTQDEEGVKSFFVKIKPSLVAQHEWRKQSI